MDEKNLKLIAAFFEQTTLLSIELTDPNNYKVLNKKDVTFLNTFLLWKVEQQITGKSYNDFSSKLIYNTLEMILDQAAKNKKMSEETMKTLKILDELVPKIMEFDKK